MHTTERCYLDIMWRWLVGGLVLSLSLVGGILWITKLPELRAKAYRTSVCGVFELRTPQPGGDLLAFIHLRPDGSWREILEIADPGPFYGFEIKGDWTIQGKDVLLRASHLDNES